MTKRIKPGFAASIGVASDMVYIHERDGELVIDGGLSASQTEALAAALADAVEDAPRELWEEAKLAYDFHLIRDEESRWQAVADAVLAAHAERERDERAAEGSHETLVRWAVYRPGQGYLEPYGLTAHIGEAGLRRDRTAAEGNMCPGDQLIRVVIRGRVER